MKVTLLSYEDGGGGAGRAALRFHRALLDSDVQSVLRVRSKKSDLDSVKISGSLIRKGLDRASAHLTPFVLGLQRPRQRDFQSVAWFPAGIVSELNESDADVLQLNWVCGLLSIEEIGRLTKPLVWRLSDMWPFAGTQHYDDDGPSARWRHGYTRANRPSGEYGLDIARWVWNRKRRAWRRPIHIVAPSRWLAACARGSALMRDWPITVIPTLLDTDQFRPWPKEVARDILKLPRDKTLILFGALNGGSEPRKGRRYLEAALGRLSSMLPDACGVIFGRSAPANPPRLGLPLHWLGHISDDPTLALAYSAADVMVLPSLQDNLPQTGIEAQSCGCPVVTFDCSGLPDLVGDRETGYLAKPADAEDLARGITWIVSDAEQQRRLSEQSRQRALSLWSPATVMPQYKTLYGEVIVANRLQP